MTFLKHDEIRQSNKFLNKGYLISKVESLNSLQYINRLIKKKINKILKKKINLDFLHRFINIDKLNTFRVELISELNKDQRLRYHYFNIARSAIYNLAGNELMMQKNINLSIQFPNDESSLLPIHSDVWSGDSPHEINLWIPLVDCYKTKSMYILEQKNLQYFLKKMERGNYYGSDKIFNLLKNKLKYLSIKKGQYLLFNQSLPHGNVVNLEKETRVSMNCRFKSIFSPYGDKKIGEFFLPITIRAATKSALDFKFPFKT